MITTFLIDQHAKALRILNAIDKANQFSRLHRIEIQTLERLEFWHPAKDNIPYLQQRIDINAAIVARLSNYYFNVVRKSTEVVMRKSVAA